MKKPRIRIADHAKLRYLERVKGVDIDALTLELEQKVQLAHALGASGLVVDGIEFIMTRDTLVTVQPRKRKVTKSAQRERFDDWARE